MEENFNIHLISNVSQDTYPNNSPSKFVTLLSNEVALKDQGWAVGVHDIMYPSQLKEAKDNDYLDTYHITKKEPQTRLPNEKVVPNKKLQPWTINVGSELQTKFPAIIGKEVKDYTKIEIDSKQEKIFLAKDFVPNTVEDYDKFCRYYLKTSSKMYYSNISQIAKKLLDILNSLDCVKKGFIEFRYVDKARKFVLIVRKADILVVLSKELANLLGFLYIDYFFAGTIWAQRSFQKCFYYKLSVNNDIYMLDVNTMATEEIPIARMNKESLEYDVPLTFDTTNLSKQAKASIPTDLKITLEFHFYTRGVILKSKTRLPNEHLQHLENFVLFSLTLGKTFRTNMKFPKYLIFELNFQNYKRSHDGDFQGIKNYFQMNKHHARRFSLSDIAEVKKLKPKLKLFKIYCKPTEITEKFQKRTNLDLQDIDDLKKYITKVNQDHKAKFTFDKLKQRFQVQIPESTAIRLSPSLSWKLGFTNTCSQAGCPLLYNGVLADHFPILHREIHELYIYTNIIESAYIGDIKAPLLLVCPFNKSTNALTHLQFSNPTYKKLNRNTFQQIEIAIFNAYGQPVDFSFGRTVVNLHFKKLSP